MKSYKAFFFQQNSHDSKHCKLLCCHN